LEKQIAGNPGRGADEVLVRSAVRLVWYFVLSYQINESEFFMNSL
jgi:hypothetical protein